MTPKNKIIKCKGCSTKVKESNTLNGYCDKCLDNYMLQRWITNNYGGTENESIMSVIEANLTNISK